MTWFSPTASSRPCPALPGALAVPATVADAGDRGGAALRRVLHGADPQPEHPRRLRPRDGGLLRLVRAARPGAAGGAAGACRGLGRGASAAALSAPSVKQRLAAVRMLFDWLVVGQVVPHNPAALGARAEAQPSSAARPACSTRDEAKALLAAIPTDSLVGLRDRALIGMLLYTFARVGAAPAMRVEDYYPMASAGGSGCTRRAASTTRCPATTRSRRISTPTSRRPGSAADPQGAAVPHRRRPDGPADAGGDGAARRLPDDRPAGRSGRRGDADRLPLLAGARHHRLPGERRPAGARAGDGGACQRRERRSSTTAAASRSRSMRSSGLPSDRPHAEPAQKHHSLLAESCRVPPTTITGDVIFPRVDTAFFNPRRQGPALGGRPRGDPPERLGSDPDRLPEDRNARRVEASVPRLVCPVWPLQDKIVALAGAVGSRPANQVRIWPAGIASYGPASAAAWLSYQPMARSGSEVSGRSEAMCAPSELRAAERRCLPERAGSAVAAGGAPFPGRHPLGLRQAQRPRFWLRATCSSRRSSGSSL